MFRVAASVLRPAGLADHAADAVQEAMVSLMKSPPQDVRSWDAVLVVTAKRRALDIAGSAPVRHASAAPDGALGLAEVDVAQDVSHAVDRQRLAAHAVDKLALLDPRHRKVVWEIVALERPRAEVSRELEVTPSRVSQIVSASLKILSDAMPREEVNE